MKNIIWLSVFINSLCVTANISYASDAFVSADGSFGQGFFRSRGSECMFITPAHVVEDAGEIILTTESKKEIVADLITVFPGDIAILKARIEPSESCPDSSWGSGDKLSALLNVYETGYIVTKIDDGSTLKTEVKIQGYDKYSSIKITSIDPKIDISKGFSGSPLFIAERPAGMLLSINEGVGVVTRQDVLNTYVSVFFNSKDEITKHISGTVGVKEITRTDKPIAHDNVFNIGDVLMGNTAVNAKTEKYFKAKKNSPVEIIAPKNKWGNYTLSILQEHDEVLYEKLVDYRYGLNDAFTPLVTGVYRFELVGKSGHGAYKVSFKQLNTNSRLMSKANVISSGDKLKGKIARAARAEYLLKAENNSPIEIKAPKNKWGNYKVRILLEDDDEILYEKLVDHRYGLSDAYTPMLTGAYRFQLEGVSGHGSYEVLVKQLNTNRQLTNRANIISYGEKLKGKIAKGARGVYLFKAERNSPIELKAPKNKWGNYSLSIYSESSDEELYAKLVDHRYGLSDAFTPLETGTYRLELVGVSGHGGYEVLFKQLTTNSRLTGKANVITPGQTLKGKLAKGAFGEYKFKAEENSPLELKAPKNKWGNYSLVIYSVSSDEPLYTKLVDHRYGLSDAFTPLETGAYRLQITGVSGHGGYEVLFKQLTTSSQLTGKANVITPGQTLKGKLAKGAFGEYTFKAEKNSPLELKAPKNKWGNYSLIIYSGSGNEALYTKLVDHRYGLLDAFTPLQTGSYRLKLVGVSGHGAYEVLVKQLTTNARLTGKANVITSGEILKGKIATGARAEYFFKANKNSPLVMKAPKNKWGNYTLRILSDTGDEALYTKLVDYRYGLSDAFTPMKTGAYRLQLIGMSGHGGYEVQVKNIK